MHVHTTFSDGTFSPEEVVSYASKVGLHCIAVCDHDTVGGIRPSLEAGERCGVEVIPAVELTADKNGTEIHVLGFFIDWQDSALGQRLDELCRQRINRIHEMVAKLKKRRVNLDAEEVFKLSGKGSVGRLHLARVLYKKGYTSSVDEAFRRYIGNRGPCYAGRIDLTPEEAIDEIIKVKGIPALAHPGVMGRDRFIPSYVKHGLVGIEVYHTDHPPAMVRHYEEMAAAYSLLVTGGSDCHGLGKGRVLMGSTTVPYELVEKLKNARR